MLINAIKEVHRAMFFLSSATDAVEYAAHSDGQEKPTKLAGWVE